MQHLVLGVFSHLQIILTFWNIPYSMIHKLFVFHINKKVYILLQMFQLWYYGPFGGIILQFYKCLKKTGIMQKKS